MLWMLAERTAHGHMTVEEIERFADRGVPVYQFIEKADIVKLGKTPAGAAQIRANVVRAINLMGQGEL